MSAKLGGKTKKQYGKRGFSRLFCHVFRKKLSSAPPKARLTRKARRTQKILRARFRASLRSGSIWPGGAPTRKEGIPLHAPPSNKVNE